ncbi:MAG: hypothetical protein RBU21_20260 [FCB group bacterium]|jgi:hypothetical protein|nr:hypothetical protein [FCB group bacterium]
MPDVTTDSLKPQQRKAIAALLERGCVTKAAEAVGVAPKTIYRWLQQPDFKSALSSAEGEVVQAAVRRLAGMSDKALSTLEAVLDDEEASAASKTRASLAVLEALLRLRELVTLGNELAELKARVENEL